MFETRYANAFRDPNIHSEVFDMVVDLNRRYLTIKGDSSSQACIYNNNSCIAIADRQKASGREWLSVNLDLRQAAAGSAGSHA
jgi:hypothetical protein